LSENRYAAIVVNRKVAAVDKIYHYAIPQHLLGKVSRGCVVRVPFNYQLLEGIVIELLDHSDYSPLKDIKELLTDKPLFTENLLQLAKFMADYYLCPYVSALQAMLPAGLSLSGHLMKPTRLKYYFINLPVSQKATLKQQTVLDYLSQEQSATAAQLKKEGFSLDLIRRMEKNGLLRAEEREIVTDGEEYQIVDTELNPEQKAAFESIIKEIENEKRPFLLFGVTGSGKTEIYVQLIKKMVAENKQCILLVPEIALSSQIINFLHQRLQLPVALLHSGLTAKEKRESWQKIAEGQYPVVVGARSAIFAPLNNLGLIIIDEEQENSYKQDNIPRFNARDIAKKRCLLEDAQLLLGSATPSVESFYQAKIGDYAFFSLPHRYFGAPLPKVEIVDMREELKEGNRSIFSRLLRQEMAEVLQQNEQIILFLNRRGYYTFYSCRNCGHVIRCPHCALPMAYHSREARLKCHYCGALSDPPKYCPLCASTAIRYFGSGTQRVADEVQKLFPQAKVARLDQDIISKRGSYDAVYKAMLSKETDILVGTQMVAKGLDFPDIALAGVITADISLNLPDWRAGERTFQLLTQISGRSGRRAKQGKAIIQTYSPQSIIIQAAAGQDYELFYEQEIALRRELYYPPFCSLIRLLIIAHEQKKAARAADVLAGFCRLELGEDVVLGPAPAPWEKIKDHYRYQILLKGLEAQLMKENLKDLWEKTKKQENIKREVFIQIDVDPLNMM
jgi:primosomal protein N' (replication factor Y)